jgi:hypothetical protein
MAITKRLTAILVGLMLTGLIPKLAQAQDDIFEGDVYEPSADEWVETMPVDGEPEAELDVNYFFDKLAPYGEWIWTPEQGWVWRPTGVSPDWRPYTYGHWTYTEHGWTWVSSYDWGWAPFHYGRWASLDHIGWVWVPGSVWGPAWVTWRYSGTHVGWSPMLAGYDWWYGWAYYPVYYSHWTFMHWNHFCDRHPHHHYTRRYRVRDAFRHTHYPRRCRDRSSPGCHRGPARHAVQKVAKTRVPIHRIENLALDRNRRSSVPTKLGVTKDSLRIFRPKMAQPSRKLDGTQLKAGKASRMQSIDLGVVSSPRPARRAAPGKARVNPGVGHADGPITELPLGNRRPQQGANIRPTRPSRPAFGSHGSFGRKPGRAIKPKQPRVQTPTRTPRVHTPSRPTTNIKPSRSYKRPSTRPSSGKPSYRPSSNRSSGKPSYKPSSSRSSGKSNDKSSSSSKSSKRSSVRSSGNSSRRSSSSSNRSSSRSSSRSRRR